MVSILINNHNYGRFLDQCLRSALGQTYRAIEVIAYDDASSDESLDILQQYSDRIRVVVGPHGDLPAAFRQANAINRAFSVSAGDVVCLLDSDDVFLPHKVATVVLAIRDHDDAVLVQHPFEEIDERGSRTGVLKPYLSGKDPRTSLYRTHSFAGLFAQTSGLSFRRAYLAKVLPIVPDRFDKIWPDVRLTRLAVYNGEIITIPTPLAQHRVHAANDSAKLADDGFYEDAIAQMYAFFNHHAPAHGWAPLDPDQSVTRPGLTGVGRLLAQLRVTEGWPEKIRLTFRLLKKAVGPDRRRNSVTRPGRSVTGADSGDRRR